MAWWEGVEEARVLIASGSSTCYLLNNGTLQELNWFKQSYGSWFLGEYVCEDGGLFIATPVDPVFILLLIFEEARMKKEGDQGKFRQLDEMMFINGYPKYQNLLSIAEESMPIVCEVKVREVVSMLGEYLKDEPWVKLLCNHLKLDLQEATKRTMVQDFLPNAPRSTSGSSNSLQSKTASQKKTSGKQAKKMETEIDLRNIRDMFTRASRRGS